MSRFPIASDVVEVVLPRFQARSEELCGLTLVLILEPRIVGSRSAGLMTKEVKILIADDDAGHARLIEKNLQRVGLHNSIERFDNGQDLLDFLFRRGTKRKRERENGYLILLDIRMPKVDGVEVLRQIKEDPELRKIPVIMLTTADDPQDVAQCHALGCSIYIVKPVDYEKLSEAIKQFGMFVSLVQVPEIK